LSKTEKVFYTVLKHFPNNVKSLALKEKEEIMQEFILLLLLQAKKRRKQKYTTLMTQAIRNILRLYHGIHYSNGKVKYRRFYLNDDIENY